MKKEKDPTFIKVDVFFPPFSHQQSTNHSSNKTEYIKKERAKQTKRGKRNSKNDSHNKTIIQHNNKTICTTK